MNSENKGWQTLNSMPPQTSSIEQPKVHLIIQAVATILHSQMLEDIAQNASISQESDLFFFSEERYMLEKPEAFDK
jgi:hypothetical protein